MLAGAKKLSILVGLLREHPPAATPALGALMCLHALDKRIAAASA